EAIGRYHLLRPVSIVAVSPPRVRTGRLELVPVTIEECSGRLKEHDPRPGCRQFPHTHPPAGRGAAAGSGFAGRTLRIRFSWPGCSDKDQEDRGADQQRKLGRAAWRWVRGPGGSARTASENGSRHATGLIKRRSCLASFSRGCHGNLQQEPARGVLEQVCPMHLPGPDL